MARKFSSIAQTTELSTGINASTTSVTVEALSGWPAGTPFTAVIDPDTATEEIVTVTGVAGTTLTVTRGADGSVAVEHDTGAEVRHMMTARDLREVHEHVEATSAHGVTGDVVGTTDTQTLTGKTLDGGDNTFTAIPQSAVTNLVTALSDLEDAIGDAESAASSALSSAVSTLNTALSGKADTSHTHPASDITGDVDAATIDGRTIFVQSSTPSGASNGDIWLVT